MVCCFFQYACTQQTYPIPGFESWSVMKDTFKVYQKFTKRIIPILCVFIVVQTVISTHITRQELEDKYRLDDILKEQRDKLKAVAAHYQEKKWWLVMSVVLLMKRVAILKIYVQGRQKVFRNDEKMDIS